MAILSWIGKGALDRIKHLEHNSVSKKDIEQRHEENIDRLGRLENKFDTRISGVHERTAPGATRDALDLFVVCRPGPGPTGRSSVAAPEVLDLFREHGRAAGRSESIIDRMMRTVRSVLRSCWKRKEIDQPYVPMDGDPEPEPRFLTHSQFRALCRELPPHLNLAARFAVLTLLRKTSQSRLTWDRVDIPKRWAWIKGERTTTGKPFGVCLSEEAVQILADCSQWAPDSDRVFTYDSKPIANFNTAAFKKAAKRAGLEGLRWHDLRHTGASLGRPERRDAAGTHGARQLEKPPLRVDPRAPGALEFDHGGSGGRDNSRTGIAQVGSAK